VVFCILLNFCKFAVVELIFCLIGGVLVNTETDSLLPLIVTSSIFYNRYVFSVDLVCCYLDWRSCNKLYSKLSEVLPSSYVGW